MSRYADIVLPVAVDKTFTYLVPPELEASARVGVRAIVPFGRTHSTGLVVGLPQSTEIRSLRTIRDIIDGEPVVGGQLLRLCRWIAEYYMAPLGDVLRTAVPHGFASSSSRYARLARTVTADELAALRRRAPKRAALVSLLSRHERMKSSDLQRATGLTSINSTLNSLAREGLITTEDILPRSEDAPVVRECIDIPSIDRTRLAAELEATPARFKRRRRLLSTLMDLHTKGAREVSIGELLRKTSATSARIRELASSGIITLFRKEIFPDQDIGTDDTTLSLVLNRDQQTALDAITAAADRGSSRTFLLHGVTGSGKTQVYIEAIRHCLQNQRSAIVLVPEIGLTPQIVRRFRSHFGNIVGVVHSRMSPAGRLGVWRRALTNECKIVIGPRSAVFAPLASPGLIVVDEEHDASYKQFDSNPRYHARDVAVVRGTFHGAVVVLGSATPSVESMFNARQGKYTLLTMPERIDRVPMPQIHIIDMAAERKQEYASSRSSLPPERRGELKHFMQSSLSSMLREKITDRLSRGEGIILLQNRRGFAPFVECAECGYAETCENCSVTMTYHLTQKHLRCHYCGAVRTPHASCPQCHGASLTLRGAGTQRVEEELTALFPGARILRMDRDTTTRRGAHDHILSGFGAGKADILLGTQMVAKGLDFPRVTLVGVISADTQLLLPDFRSSERTFQLLTQVAGRAGRSTLRGEVIIQTHQADHPILRHIVAHDYNAFYEEELKERQDPGYPPAVRIALVEFRAATEERARNEADTFAAALRGSPAGLTILGPSPAVISKIRSEFRWQLLIKSPKRDESAAARLRAALHTARERTGSARSRDVRITIDIDPVAML